MFDSTRLSLWPPEFGCLQVELRLCRSAFRTCRIIVWLTALGILAGSPGQGLGDDPDPAVQAGQSLKNKSEEPDAAVSGRLVDPGSLRDIRGLPRSLQEFSGSKAYVLAFLGVDCPLANQYVPRLKDLFDRYAARKVEVFGIYPHELENIDRIAAHAQDHDIPFTVFKDMHQALADALGVERTPAVCVLDSQFVLRYHGRIDDQYEVNRRRADAGRTYLIEAIDAILADLPVPVERTTYGGCLLARHVPKPNRDVTFTRDVALILQQRCEFCHREQGQAPFSLATYADAVRWSEMLKEVVIERRMPPWSADSRHGRFRNDRRLTEQEVDTIVAWVDHGTPFGDARELPPPRRWLDQWTIGEPDVVIESPVEFFVPADGVVDYQYALVPRSVTDQVFSADCWLQGAEAMPSSRSIVHHLQFNFVRPGVTPINDASFSGRPDIIGIIGWVPGDPQFVLPEGTALHIPKGTQIQIEAHIVPNGRATKERPRLAIQFAKQPPRRAARLIIPSTFDFRIAPGDPHHQGTCDYVFEHNSRLLSINPHMHLRGKSFQLRAFFPDGQQETLLSVPRYDFYWQTFYLLEKPAVIPKGTRLEAVGYWDNSRGNARNPDPTAEVGFGLKSTDEMLVAWMFVEDERPVASSIDSNASDSDAGAAARMRLVLVGACVVGAVIMILFVAIRHGKSRRRARAAIAP